MSSINSSATDNNTPSPGTIEYYQQQFEQSQKEQIKQKDEQAATAKIYQALQNIIKQRQISHSDGTAITTNDIDKEVSHMNNKNTEDENKEISSAVSQIDEEQLKRVLGQAFQNVSKRPGVLTIDAIYAEAKRLLDSES